MPRAPDPITRRYKGLPFLKAVEDATARKIPWRLVRQDDDHKVVTRDHRLDRLNFEVDDGFVTECRWG
jgi:hypothetical protein